MASGAAASLATPMSKADFNKRMQAIGAQAQRQLLALPAPSKGSSTGPEAAAMAGGLRTIYLRVARRMGALTPPTAIKADFELLRLSFQADARYATVLQDALLHGTAQQAARAQSKLNINPENARATAAVMRMSAKGYNFGSFFH